MIFKKIPKTNGRYYISSHGDVKSFCLKKNGVILKKQIDRNGYYSINIAFKDGIKRVLVHRLVASVFLKKEPSKNEVNHKDGNKKNNHLNNLEWCTRSFNNKHAFDHGLKKPAPSYGEKHGRSRLSEKQVTEIRSLYSPRKVSLNFLAKKFNISKRQVGRIVNNLHWKNV